MSNWKAKMSNNFEQKKKRFVPNCSFRNNYTRNFPNKNFQGNKGNSQLNPNFQRNKEPVRNHSNYIKNNERKESVKCWECNGSNYASVCRNQKKNIRNIHTMQEEMIVGDLERTMHRINATLENRQADYQTSMVEVEGKLNQTPIYILIDRGARLSYISPDLVEKCNLSVENFAKSWLVQLATGAKIKVISFVKNCTIKMDQFESFVKLNVLPLGSYDMLIGMDWLEKHRVVLNCFDKTFTCVNNGRETVNVKGISRKTTIRRVFALQLKRVV